MEGAFSQEPDDGSRIIKVQPFSQLWSASRRSRPQSSTQGVPAVTRARIHAAETGFVPKPGATGAFAAAVYPAVGKRR